jgi:hypothetical protein
VLGGKQVTVMMVVHAVYNQVVRRHLLARATVVVQIIGRAIKLHREVMVVQVVQTAGRAIKLRPEVMLAQIVVRVIRPRQEATEVQTAGRAIKLQYADLLFAHTVEHVFVLHTMDRVYRFVRIGIGIMALRFLDRMVPLSTLTQITIILIAIMDIEDSEVVSVSVLDGNNHRCKKTKRKPQGFALFFFIILT